MNLNVKNAKSQDDLADQIGEVGLEIPERHIRTNEDEEAYLCRRLILGMACDNRIRYPISIRQSDAPDFEIVEDGVSWELEVTQATTVEDQMGLTRFSQSEATVALNGEYGGRGHGGYIGESAEREVVCDIIEAITRKKDKNYAKDSCRLLIYVNSNPGLVVDENRLFELLMTELPENPFSHVYVYSGSMFGAFAKPSTELKILDNEQTRQEFDS